MVEPANSGTPPNNHEISRLRARIEIIVVWSTLALFASIRSWGDLRAGRFADPDDATRLVQVRELLDGQGWWDLTLNRVAPGGVDMHWSRHVDALLGGVITMFRPLVGSDSAELIALLVVPLGLLLAALWLVSSIARWVSPRVDVGLYAMVVFGFGAGALSRLGPGRIDHHGLQVVMLLAMVRLVLAWPSVRALVVAGVAGGMSLTVGLETLPAVAAILAGVGMRWGVSGASDRSAYRAVGFSLVASAVGSNLLFGPPGRILSLECDVFSLGFFGLIAIPALGLALVGGSSVSTRVRWWTLTGLAAAGVGWFGVLTPTCAAGPYGAYPDIVGRIWFDLIIEAQGLVSYASALPWAALGLLIGPTVGLAYLGWLTWKSRNIAAVPWLASLFVVLAFCLWQVRVVPQAQALAAPALGVAVTRLRNAVKWVPARAVAAAIAVLILSGFAFGFVSERVGASKESGAPPAASCVTEDLLIQLAALDPGLVLVEVNYGPDVLVHTEHDVLSPPYHRAYRNIVASYELFTSDPGNARELAEALGADYVMVCDETAISNSWSADNEAGFLAGLLDDSPPPWARKVIDTGPTRVYQLD